MRYAVVVPTYNAGDVWSFWIQALLLTGIDSADVYIIDSGSVDDTVVLSRKAGFNIVQIDKKTFNHGGTRQKAISHLSGYEFVVYLTQDAVLRDAESIQELLLPFEDEGVGAVCGRQLPNIKAGPIEAHARLFNYVGESSVNSIEDVKDKGLKAIFLSNSFAAYRISALDMIGGFPDDVIFGEDMFVAAKLLKAGYKVAYAASACVYHSHSYSLLQEMRRYFDMGVFHSREPWLKKEFGRAEKEGVKFINSEMRYLWKHAFWRIPEALLRTAVKYAGYKMGVMERYIPLNIKRKMSMNSGYFNIA